jgi:hypothetical protein
MSYNLVENRWHTRSLSDQLANIGSEFVRALRAKKENKPARFEPAFFRCLTLLNGSITDRRWKLHQIREISRIKEQIIDHLYSEIPNIDAVKGLERYFYYFGRSRQSILSIGTGS